MTNIIEQLAQIFKAMVENYNSFGEVWKNIPLAKEAFAIMLSLPPTLKDEFETPEAKANLLEQMLDQMEETTSPRFCIEVREYILELDSMNEENILELARLKDYINPNVTMEEYCKKYGVFLKFDPIERTQKWEEVIYEVEKECDKRLEKQPRHMGFCFIYWSTKKTVLAERGIVWRSPSLMNPGVMFD